MTTKGIRNRKKYFGKKIQISHEKNLDGPLYGKDASFTKNVAKVLAFLLKFRSFFGTKFPSFLHLKEIQVVQLRSVFEAL